MKLLDSLARFIHCFIPIPEQLIRFFIVGAINTLFAYSLYALFVFLHFHYTLAVLLANVLGTCFSFKTLGTLVFNNPKNSLIFKFFLVYGGCYFLQIALVGCISNSLFANLYIAGAISSLLVALVSFCLNKWFVFR